MLFFLNLSEEVVVKDENAFLGVTDLIKKIFVQPKYVSEIKKWEP